MTDTERESGRGSYRATLKWTVALVWRHHRALLVAAVSIVIVRGLLPAGLALTARGLINESSALLQDPSAPRGILLFWLVLGFFVALVEAIGLHLSNLVVARLSDQMNALLTADILKAASKKPLAFFEDAHLREMIERARLGASGRVSNFIASTLAGVTNTFQALSLIMVLVYVEPLVLVVVGPIAVPFLLYQWRLSKERYHTEHSRTKKKRWTDYFSFLLTSPRSFAEIKLLGIADHLVEIYEKFIMEFKEQDWRLERKNFSGFALFSFATVLAFYAVLLRVALHVIGGDSTLGDLAIFGGASVRLRMTLERAITGKTKALEQLLFIEDLRRFLLDGGEAKAPGVSLASPPRGQIEFRNVGFTYPGGSSPAIKDFSLRINPGETLALVGRNGAGKTTCVKLLTRLYDPDEGVILIDGTDIRTLEAGDVHRMISVVMQHYGRYEASARENLAYGDWERLKDRPDLVEEISSRPGIRELTESLPDGLDTQLGRTFGDHDLSDGQWQMLAIARGFARKAPILILDEPTASLDARSELDVFNQFTTLARGRTTILISHRFSTISMADRIAVVEDGGVIEEGSHSDLMAGRGEYADLYTLHTKWMNEGRVLE